MGGLPNNIDKNGVPIGIVDKKVLAA